MSFQINTPSVKCTEATSPELGRHVKGTESDSFAKSFFSMELTAACSLATLSCRNRLVYSKAKIVKAQLCDAQEAACGGKVLASHAGLLLTRNIMLTDAKSLAAAVNEGIFLSGFITAGDPFYMK